MSRPVFRVTAARSGKWWALQCQEHPGALSQVKRLDQAAEDMREPIAWVAQIEDLHSFDIEVVPEIPGTFWDDWNRALQARETAARATTEAAEASRSAARTLASQGITVRDIGAIMGVSFQRAQQLVSR